MNRKEILLRVPGVKEVKGGWLVYTPPTNVASAPNVASKDWNRLKKLESKMNRAIAAYNDFAEEYNARDA